MGNQARKQNTTHHTIKTYSQFIIHIYLHSAPHVQIIYQLCTISYPPLINDCIPAKKLLRMRVTSVWDDGQHSQHFQQPGLLLNRPCLSTTGQPFSHRSYTGLTPQRDESETEFTTASVFSFNCFSPRRRRQESGQKHAKRQH